MAIKIAAKPKRPAQKIGEGLKEALAVAKGEAEPAAVHVRKRGRPSSGKERVTIMLDPDVLASYRSLGKGWQSRLNDDLREIRGL